MSPSVGELLRRRPDRSFPRPCGSGCFRERECRPASSRRPRSSPSSPMQSSAKATGRLMHLRRARPRSGLQRILRVAAFRAAEMREQDRLAALVGDFEMVGATRSMRVSVGDLAVVDRDVEVDADEHALALEIGVIEGAEAVCDMSCAHRLVSLSPRLKLARRRCRPAPGHDEKQYVPTRRLRHVTLPRRPGRR